MELWGQQCLLDRLLQQLEEEYIHGEAGRLVLYHASSPQAGSSVCAFVKAGINSLSMGSGDSRLRMPLCRIITDMSIIILIPLISSPLFKAIIRQMISMIYQVRFILSIQNRIKDRKKRRRIKNNSMQNMLLSCLHIISIACISVYSKLLHRQKNFIKSKWPRQSRQPRFQ